MQSFRVETFDLSPDNEASSQASRFIASVRITRTFDNRDSAGVIAPKDHFLAALATIHPSAWNKNSPKLRRLCNDGIMLAG